jgi:sortase A
MAKIRFGNVFSYALIAGGAALLFLGSKAFLDSHLGQGRAERQFENSAPAPVNVSLRKEPSPAPGGVIAKLVIPRLHSKLFVVEGDGAAELRLGPGHLRGSAMPGQPGNCIIAGHRDTHFRVLKDIRPGDDIILQTQAGQFLYRVRGTQVVRPANTSSLRPVKDAELHLITCYPFFYVGPAPKRFVVTARLAAAVGNGPPPRSSFAAPGPDSVQ